MFTGIIQSIGERLGEFTYPDGSIRLYLQTSKTFLNDVSIGDSIALQGACMTVCEKFTMTHQIQHLKENIIPTLNMQSLNQKTAASIDAQSHDFEKYQAAFCSFDVSHESLSKIVNFTSLNEYNLEKALRLNDFIGGHLVSGHVDGQARLHQQKTTAEGSWLQIEIPQEFAIFMMKKGSVTLNGVSLTINQLHEPPHISPQKATISTDNSVTPPSHILIELYLIPHTLENTTLKNLKVGDFINLEIDLMARYIQRLLLKNRITD